MEPKVILGWYDGEKGERPHKCFDEDVYDFYDIYKAVEYLMDYTKFTHDWEYPRLFVQEKNGQRYELKIETIE